MDYIKSGPLRMIIDFLFMTGWAFIAFRYALKRVNKKLVYS